MFYLTASKYRDQFTRADILRGFREMLLSGDWTKEEFNQVTSRYLAKWKEIDQREWAEYKAFKQMMGA
jgi:hypothetical protein